MEKNDTFSLFDTSVSGNMTFEYVMTFHCTSVSRHLHVEGLKHKCAEYMPLAHDKRVKLTDNQYISYALLSLVGSMYLPGLCSKHSMYTQRYSISVFASKEGGGRLKLAYPTASCEILAQNNAPGAYICFWSISLSQNLDSIFMHVWWGWLTCHTPMIALAIRMSKMTNGSTKAVTFSSSSSSKMAKICRKDKKWTHQMISTTTSIQFNLEYTATMLNHGACKRREK